MFISSWNQFKQGFYEVRYLIGVAERAPTIVVTRIGLSEQQILLRAAVLQLSSHVECFFNSVIEEVADDLAGDWNSLSVGMQRYVSLQSRKYLLDELEKDEYIHCASDKDIKSLCSIIKEAYDWLERPNLLSKSPYRGKLEYFYRGSAPKAIENVLRVLHKDRKSFFGWIESKGFDRSRFWIVLEQLVTIRNEITHRGSMVAPSVSDAKLYLATATFIVRQVRLFLE